VPGGYLLSRFGSRSRFVLLGATRHYYLAAENVTWDYAPSGLNLIEGRPIPLPWASQTKWPKLRYIW
jgi:hypothetical protein